MQERNMHENVRVERVTSSANSLQMEKKNIRGRPMLETRLFRVKLIM
jgi:hypothetical protein